MLLRARRFQISSSVQRIGLTAQFAALAGIIVDGMAVALDIRDLRSGNASRIVKAGQVRVGGHRPGAGSIQRQDGGTGRVVGIDRSGQR